jgi:hypothetical protein
VSLGVSGWGNNKPTLAGYHIPVLPSAISARFRPVNMKWILIEENNKKYNRIHQIQRHPLNTNVLNIGYNILKRFKFQVAIRDGHRQPPWAMSCKNQEARKKMIAENVTKS